MQRSGQRQFHIGYAALLAAVFGIIFVLSLWTPLIADDFNYTFGYASNTRISSLRDIWASMAWHRKMLNGRVFSHGWLSLVLMYPRWVFAALNAAVAAFFTWTLEGFLRDQGCRHPVRATACVWMLLWICMPGFGQVFFWTAGACNYFWGVAFAWFIIWRAKRAESGRTGLMIRTVLLLLPAFAAGAWSEHISFAMLTILFLLTVWDWVRDKRIPWAKACILLSGCAGYLYLMLAPGSKLLRRLHDAGDPTEEGNLVRMIRVIPGGLRTVGLLALLAVVLMILLFRLLGTRRGGRVIAILGAALCCAGALPFAAEGWRENGLCGMISSSAAGFFAAMGIYLAVLAGALRKQTEKDSILMSLILSFGGLCGVALFIFGEYFPIRGFCAPVAMLLPAAVLLTESEERDSLSTGMKRKLVILAVCFALCFGLGAADIYSVHTAALEREAAFLAAAAGDKRVTVSPYAFRTKYSAQYGNPDLVYDADWPNGVMADYYDVVRIIVE